MSIIYISIQRAEKTEKNHRNVFEFLIPHNSIVETFANKAKIALIWDLLNDDF